VIVLDENINESQRLQLRNWHIPVRQIGVDLKQQGIQDEAIIPFLHQLHQPTFLHVILIFLNAAGAMTVTVWFI
jgi:hypothetical protein